MSQETSPKQDDKESDRTTRLTHELWEEALVEGRLLGLECEECGYVTATPKAACVRCGSRDVVRVDLPTTGRVYTKSTIEIAPDAQGSGYQIAFVDIGEARILGRIADGERVEIDDKVELRDSYEYDGDVVAVFGPA